MGYVVWSEMFSVGVPYIDNQHKRLLNIVNDFHCAMKENRDKEILFQILNSLVSYAETHFRDEESIMEMVGYPPEQIEVHKSMHENLINDIFALNQEIRDSWEKTTLDLEMFLNSWLIRHILLEDKTLAPYAGNIRENGSRKSE